MLGKCKGDLKPKFEQIKSQFNSAFRKHLHYRKKNIFEEKSNIWQNLENTFKKFKIKLFVMLLGETLYILFFQKYFYRKPSH